MNLVPVVDDSKNILKVKSLLGDEPSIEACAMDVSRIDHWQDIKSDVERSFGSLDFLNA